jgi:hypothetical protein
VSVARYLFDAASFQAQTYDWRAIVASAIVISLVITYAVTSMTAILALRSSSHGRRPPILPYWIPFFGSAVPYFTDGPRVAANLMYV